MNNTLLYFFGLLLLLLVSGKLLAQNNSNPFELKPRLQIEQTVKENPANEDTQKGNPFDMTTPTAPPPPSETQANSLPDTPPLKNENPADIPLDNKNNPFDLGGSTTIPVDKISPSEETDSSKNITSIPETKEIASEKKSFWSFKSTVSPQTDIVNFRKFFNPVMIVMLLIFTILMTLFRSIFGKTYRAFLNDNILSILYRERGSILISPYSILYLMFLINAGIFVFLLTHHFQFSPFENRLYNLILSIGVVFALFLAKHWVLQILAYVFPIEKEMQLYNFTIVVFGIMIGILLIPANILIAYAPASLTSIIIYSTLGLIGLVYLFRSLRGVFLANKFVLFHKFHFLLYICTVELAPVFILLKLLS